MCFFKKYIKIIFFIKSKKEEGEIAVEPELQKCHRNPQDHSYILKNGRSSKTEKT
jgi:hypothetical protein